MEEKHNHSFNPPQTQPINKDGTYAEKNGGEPSSEGQAPEFGSDQGDGFDIDESSLDDFDVDEGNLEKFDSKEKNYLSIDSDVALSESKKEQGELVERGFQFGHTFGYFKDPRMKLACLDALKQANDDYPIGNSVGAVKMITRSAFNYLGQTQAGVYTNDPSRIWVQSISISNFQNIGPAGMDAHSFINIIKENVAVGFMDDSGSDDKTMRYVMTHEYGHVVEWSLLNKMVQKGALPDNSKPKINAISVRKGIIEKAMKMFPGSFEGELLNDTSQYGHKDACEWFAETFASMYNEKPRKVALAMREYLKENF